MLTPNGFKSTAFVLGLSVLASVAAPATFADHTHTAQGLDTYHLDQAGLPYVDGRDPAFRQAHPLRLFVRLDVGRGGRGRGVDNPGEARLLRVLSRNLPYGVSLAHNRRSSDLVLNVEERQYDLQFHVIDRDREDKKYKRRKRYAAANSCGVPSRAFYTEVTERATAYYAYDIGIRIKGYGRDHTVISGRESDKFQYATDLRAATACGIQPTHVPPSRKVARLFDRASPEYRRAVALDVRQDTLNEVGRKLSYIIRAKADLYYRNLAEAYNRDLERSAHQKDLYGYERQGFDGPYSHSKHEERFRHPDSEDERALRQFSRTITGLVTLLDD